MNIPHLPILLAVIGSITIGTAYAVTTFDSGLGETPVQITGGNIQLLNGEIISDRTDGFSSRLVFKSDAGGSALLRFEDKDDNQVTHFRLTSNGAQFEIIDLTHGFRKDLVLRTDTGNIGMGVNSPQEKLDVNGNVRARGDLITDTGVIRTASGDICIGNCP